MTTQPAHAETVVDAAVAALRETVVSDRPSAALIDRTIAALHSHGNRPRLAAPGAAGRSSRTGWWRLGLAATVGLATALAFMIVPGIGGRDGNAAFAAMLEKVREMKSVRYRVTVNGVDGDAPEDVISFVVTETTGGARCETGSRVTIFSGVGLLILDTKAKTAVTVSAEEDGPPRAKRPDLLAQFREADGGLGEPVEDKQVGPVAARGYRVSKKKRRDDGEPGSMRVYVDPATELPVRVEQEVRLSDDDKGQRAASVLSDFEWGVEVDPQLVSPDTPAGYRHEKLDIIPARAPISPPEAIAAGLRFYAERMKASLPDTLDGFEATRALDQTIYKQDKKAMVADVPTMLTRVHELVGPWLGLMGARDALEKQNIKVHYLGKGLKAGDATQIVAWWKAEKAGRAIAIYGDFSVREIDESAAPPPATGAGR
jgi:outer membrane lipoprotein-sorting protein